MTLYTRAAWLHASEVDRNYVRYNSWSVRPNGQRHRAWAVSSVIFFWVNSKGSISMLENYSSAESPGAPFPDRVISMIHHANTGLMAAVARFNCSSFQCAASSIRHPLFNIRCLSSMRHWIYVFCHVHERYINGSQQGPFNLNGTLRRIFHHTCTIQIGMGSLSLWYHM